MISDRRCMLMVNFTETNLFVDYTSTYDVDISHVLIRNDSHKRLSSKKIQFVKNDTENTHKSNIWNIGKKLKLNMIHHQQVLVIDNGKKHLHEHLKKLNIHILYSQYYLSH